MPGFGGGGINNGSNSDQAEIILITFAAIAGVVICFWCLCSQGRRFATYLRNRKATSSTRPMQVFTVPQIRTMASSRFPADMNSTSHHNINVNIIECPPSYNEVAEAVVDVDQNLTLCTIDESDMKSPPPSYATVQEQAQHAQESVIIGMPRLLHVQQTQIT